MAGETPDPLTEPASTPAGGLSAPPDAASIIAALNDRAVEAVAGPAGTSHAIAADTSTEEHFQVLIDNETKEPVEDTPKPVGS